MKRGYSNPIAGSEPAPRWLSIARMILEPRFPNVLVEEAPRAGPAIPALTASFRVFKWLV